MWKDSKIGCYEVATNVGGPTSESIELDGAEQLDITNRRNFCHVDCATFPLRAA